MYTKNNSYSIVIIVIFILAIFIPFAGAILQEDKGLSYTEKRKLQQFPAFPEKFSGLSDFIADFEEYYNDQFGLRDIFLRTYTATKKLLGDHNISSNSQNVGTKNIIKGKNGWFFLNRKWDGDPVADYRNLHLYSEADLWRSTLLFAARTDWLKRQGIEYLLFFAPNKHTIYSEYLPDYIQKEGEISSWDQLNDSLRRYTNVHFVDLRSTLINAKSNAAQYWKENKDQAALYFKKDSHWNAGGADIAQYEVAKKITELFPGKITPIKRNPKDFVMMDFAGDISMIMGSKEKEAYGPVLMGGTCTPETLIDYLQRTHVTTCKKGKLNAVIFYDSFFPPLKPYFTDYFHRTAYFWERMRKGKVEQQISLAKPDIVIEQRAERHLPFTPHTKNENYNQFWVDHWPKWKRKVFGLDLKEAGKGKLRTYNVELKYGGKRKGLRVVATTDDPHIYLPKVGFQKNKLYLIKVQIFSEHQTDLQFYYHAIGKKQQYPTEPYSITVPLQKGENTIGIPLFSMDLAGDWRIDPGKKAGKYYIRELAVKELDQISLK